MVRLKDRKPEEVNEKLEKIVLDTSALISGRLMKLIESDDLNGATVIIPEVVMGELQAQASRGKEIGFLGVDEIKAAQKVAEERKIKIEFFGTRASYEDIALAKSGRIDAIILEIAKKQKAVLITCDLPQALIAEASGVGVKYYASYEVPPEIKLNDFFTEDTMSVHLKDGCLPLAKRGKPGAFELVKTREEFLTTDELEFISKEIFDVARQEQDAFVEYGEHGVSIVQLKNMRIAICRPPFSDGVEITVVRPLIKLGLDDYELSDKLKKRLDGQAEGILLSGPPGSGKSTFAASLAEFYMNKGRIVKTMENPRDLQVPKEVTQYAPLNHSFAKTADILLLVRPDYVIFDEIRKTREFEIFADMRMAGIGLVGVVHASNPVDSIQRFLGRVDMGVIPHVVDTVVFINSGKVETVYSLSMTVRTPTGMTEADLARPLVEVRDFETGGLEYEIYTYGEQTVVLPVKEESANPLEKLASERIYDYVRKFDRDAQVSILNPNKALVRVRNDVVPRIIGKEGVNVKKLEAQLGISIDIEPLAKTFGKEVGFEFSDTGKYVVLSFGKHLVGKNANVFVEGEYLFSATVGRKGDIRVSKDSDIGDELIRAVSSGKMVKCFV